MRIISPKYPLYWRLSNFYFFYFAVLGALVPYWGLWLQHRGFNAVAIGELMAILMVTKIIAPNIWGWLGDHLGHRMSIVRLAALLSMVSFIGIYGAESYGLIALVMVLFSFFWNASLPQFEVVTFTYLRRDGKVSRYALIRIWGSIGFVVVVALLGMLVDQYGAEVIMPVVLALFAGIWLSALMVSDPDPEPHPSQQEPLRKLLVQPTVLGFFAVIFLMQVSHGPYYTFYSIHMSEYGYSKTLIGQLWASAVVAEVLLFMVIHRALAYWRAEWLLLASLLLAALRWSLIGYWPDSLSALLFAQLLHAGTFGLSHVASMHLVQHHFRGRLQGRGQALYSSISYGAGGAIGSLCSGYLWESVGAGLTFALAALCALLGALIAGWLACRR